MTLYLTDNTPPAEVAAAREEGVVAFKLYPAGATTNSGGWLRWRPLGRVRKGSEMGCPKRRAAKQCRGVTHSRA
jgi:hypothetical protein